MRKLAALGLGLNLAACTVPLEEASGVREETIERDIVIKRDFEKTCELFKIGERVRDALEISRVLQKIGHDTELEQKLDEYTNELKDYSSDIKIEAAGVVASDLSTLRQYWYDNILHGSSCNPAYSLKCEVSEPVKMGPITNKEWMPITKTYVMNDIWGGDCEIEGYETYHTPYEEQLRRGEKNIMRDIDEGVNRLFDIY